MNSIQYLREGGNLIIKHNNVKQFEFTYKNGVIHEIASSCVFHQKGPIVYNQYFTYKNAIVISVYGKINSIIYEHTVHFPTKFVPLEQANIQFMIYNLARHVGENDEAAEMALILSKYHYKDSLAFLQNYNL